MDPVKSAVEKQTNPRCELEEVSESGGIILEVVSGKDCPIRVEYEQFGNRFEFDTGIVRFNENILYLRRGSPEQKREGLEMHSQFEFHMDMSVDEMLPKKILVNSRAKHLHLGIVELAGEIRFADTKNSEATKSLDFMINNSKQSSRIQIDFGSGVMKVDGNEVPHESTSEIFKFNHEPDLNIPFTGS